MILIILYETFLIWKLTLLHFSFDKAAGSSIAVK